MRKLAASITIFVSLFLPTKIGACPNKYTKIEGICYKLNTDLHKQEDAEKSCEDEGGGLGVFIDSIPRRLGDMVNDYITPKLEKGYYWIGFKMSDTSTSKRIGERDWTFDIDDSKVVQHDYEVWAKEPQDRTHTCAVLNGSLEFKVQALDCGGRKLPVVCEKKDDPCHDSMKAYFQYGDQCLLVFSSAVEYNKIYSACSSDAPVPIKNNEMKEHAKRSVVNSFLGGALFVALQKKPDGSFRYNNGREAHASLWEKGEPRSDYNCVGLSWQIDGSVKLKTINCEFHATSVCMILGNVSHAQ